MDSLLTLGIYSLFTTTSTCIPYIQIAVALDLEVNTGFPLWLSALTASTVDEVTFHLISLLPIYHHIVA
jgi:hypothetical protein